MRRANVERMHPIGRLIVIGAAILAMALAAPQGGPQGQPEDLTKSSGSNTYFNQPGADLAAHDAAVRDCLDLAMETQSADNSVPWRARDSFVGALASGASTGLWRIVGRKRIDANLENCMVVRGWRVVSIPTDEAQAIHKLSPAEQASRLESWVGADPPYGQVVREWRNGAQDARTIKFVQVRYNGDSAISLTALATGPAEIGKGNAVDPYLSQYGFNSPNPLKPAGLANVASDRAVVIFQISGANSHNTGSTVILRRAQAKPVVYPETSVDEVYAAQEFVFHPHGQIWAFAVTPGTWRVAALMGGANVVLNFCLGAPAFDVRPGEIVYAGSFNVTDQLGPDLSLAPLRSWLGPDSALLDRIRPATYVNGTRSDCDGSYIYALEKPGAPFANDYTWRSTAVRQSSGR